MSGRRLVTLSPPIVGRLEQRRQGRNKSGSRHDAIAPRSPRLLNPFGVYVRREARQRSGRELRQLSNLPNQSDGIEHIAIEIQDHKIGPTFPDRRDDKLAAFHEEHLGACRSGCGANL